jgi:hypothetical protein
MRPVITGEILFWETEGGEPERLAYFSIILTE